VQRLGSKRAIEVDVHVIASTSEDLEKRVAEGSFRGDLFYRLSPYEIWLPPLKQRMRDIPALIERILNRLSRQHDRPLELAPEARSLRQDYAWPGNIRELEGVLERATIQAGSSRLIVPMHLPQFIRYPQARPSGDGQVTRVPSLAEVEREAILQAARLCHGNVTRMAKMLGIGRTTVWRRLKNLDIPLAQFRNNT
jgi:transcriptional activator for dhaKLM operon